MNRPLYYYAKLNENDVCYGFETLAKKFREEDMPSNLVHLVDYNESYLWKKYDRNLKAFGQEKFEPDTDFDLLERIDILEQDNQALSGQVSSLNATLQDVNSTNETLIQSIADLSIMIAMMQTP